jgi:hypothetical protein
MLSGRFAIFAVCCVVALSHVRAADCSRTSIGFTPLMDLGTGTYQGEEGGLYPGGGNAPPPGHAAEGLARAAAIRPLDGSGAPSGSGRIVLLSIGMSNTTQEFSRFVEIADADPEKNPRLTLVDGAQGGQDARVISDPNATFWTNVDSRLAAAGATREQVQAVWLKEAIAGITGAFPSDALTLRGYLESIVQILHDRFPNLQIVYLASRTYAGYASTTLNPEPYAYQSGFAVKWLIRDQIDGDPDLNFDPESGPVRAPWLAWGPYLWADGLTPRSDGFFWECADFAADGTHPSTSGRQKVADLLLAFMKSDPTATPWFLAPPPPAFPPSESEPNDTPESANAIADGFTLRGAIASSSDVDHFALAGRAGEEITIHVRTPGSSLNPRFTLDDGTATLLEDADDGDGADAFGCVVLTADAGLRLRVEGEAGTTGSYEVSVARSVRTGSETEPNDTPALANFLRDGDLLAATIDPAGDRDVYGLDAVEGTGFELAARTCGGPSPAGRDLQMRIVNGAGTVLFSDDDSGLDADPLIRGVLPASSSGYFAVVRSAEGTSGGPDFRYEIELRLFNVSLGVTPVTRGPVYRRGDRIDLLVTARNETPQPQENLRFRIEAARIGGTSTRTLIERAVSGPLPAGFERTVLLSLGPVPRVPRVVGFRLDVTLAQTGGPTASWHGEIELQP